MAVIKETTLISSLIDFIYSTIQSIATNLLALILISTSTISIAFLAILIIWLILRNKS
jgi:hypothetical protein